MATEYSVNIDWYSEFREHPGRWTNHGRNALRASCNHYDADASNGDKPEDSKTSNVDYRDYCERCDISEDSCEPMMNYGYPLHHLPDDEQILAIAKETCLTVMENEDTGECYLVLCGGGMDLSQQIAKAYMICGYVPDALAFNVSTQYGLNLSGDDYFRVMSFVKESLVYAIADYQNKVKQIQEAIRKAKGESEGVIK